MDGGGEGGVDASPSLAVATLAGRGWQASAQVYSPSVSPKENGTGASALRNYQTKNIKKENESFLKHKYEENIMIKKRSTLSIL